MAKVQLNATMIRTTIEMARFVSVIFMLYRLSLERDLLFSHTRSTLPCEHGQPSVVGLDDSPRERPYWRYVAHVSCLEMI
jgi:hypothetical protein